MCSAFRNERRDLHLSSSLITEALAATRFYWSPPAEGMITFVDVGEVRHKRDPGRCYLKAGFHRSGTQPCCTGKPSTTEGGLVALHISADQMPIAVAPIGSQVTLDFAGLPSGTK